MITYLQINSPFLLLLFLKVKLGDILRNKILRQGFTVACVVMMSQPLSGINAVSLGENRLNLPCCPYPRLPKQLFVTVL